MSVRYPEADAAWVATDRFGNLAALITAGVAPIPTILLERGLNIEAVENAILAMPRTSEARMMISNVPDPKSFVELAQRGFFIFDWRDAHRIRAECTYAYEIVCKPVQPLRMGIEYCGPKIEIVFKDLGFHSCNQILIGKYFEDLTVGD
jgi:hypothetical protein